MGRGKKCIFPNGCVVFDIEKQIGATSIELNRLLKTRGDLDTESDAWHAINETVKDTQYEIKGLKSEAASEACQNCIRANKYKR